MAYTPTKTKHGFTLVELLVVIAIIGILIGLLLPAVMAARESARKAECQNHLKQLGLAMSLHHDAQRHFATDGWGYQWAGDPDRGFGQTQPGGWIFNILPYVEQRALRGRAKGLAPAAKRAAMGQVLQTPLAVFQCPSRRSPGLYPYTEFKFPLRNSDIPARAAKSDYAVCAGDFGISARPGPKSTSPADANGYDWPDFGKMTGISFIRSTIRLSDVTDGSSQTIMVGEKYVPLGKYDCETYGDDQAMYIGDDADIRRWTSAPPLSDREDIPDIDHFGSAHDSGCYFVFCDGSVHFISFDVDPTAFRNLGNRHSGSVIDLGSIH